MCGSLSGGMYSKRSRTQGNRGTTLGQISQADSRRGTVRKLIFTLAVAVIVVGGCSPQPKAQNNAEVDRLAWSEVVKFCGQGSEAETVVPLLVSYLDDEQHRLDAANMIGQYGLEARSSVPSLIRHLHANGENYGQWPFTCNLLTAIGKIGPGAKDAVPYLLELLDKKPQHSRRLHAHVIGVLGLIGPDAKSAVPRLMGHVHPESPHNTTALSAVENITRQEFGKDAQGIKNAQSWWENEGQK